MHGWKSTPPLGRGAEAPNSAEAGQAIRRHRGLDSPAREGTSRFAVGPPRTPLEVPEGSLVGAFSQVRKIPWGTLLPAKNLPSRTLSRTRGILGVVSEAINKKEGRL